METINLGGEEYYILKKDEIDGMEQQRIKAEQDLNNIKTIVGNAFKGLGGLISFENTVEQRATTNKTRTNRKDQRFKVAPSAQMLWKITDIDADGCLYGLVRWNKMTQPKVGMKYREVVNNPEKRKELGM